VARENVIDVPNLFEAARAIRNPQLVAVNSFAKRIITPFTARKTLAVLRHREVNDFLAVRICIDLQIPRRSRKPPITRTCCKPADALDVSLTASRNGGFSTGFRRPRNTVN